MKTWHPPNPKINGKDLTMKILEFESFMAIRVPTEIFEDFWNLHLERNYLDCSRNAIPARG